MSSTTSARWRSTGSPTMRMRDAVMVPAYRRGPAPRRSPAYTPPVDQQYFSAQPSSKRRTRQIEVTLDGATLTFQTDSGVFSPGRLDLGSATLLRLAPPPPPDAAVLVDLGAGWGPLSVALARRTPTGTVWAVEPNDRARELCAINAQRLAPGRIRTVGPDGGPDAPIDLLWSNPPVRIGKAELYPLLESWLDRLAPDGRAVFVMSKNLGGDSLHRHLEDRGHPVERLGSKAGYRVLSIEPRR